MRRTPIFTVLIVAIAGQHLSGQEIESSEKRVVAEKANVARPVLQNQNPADQGKTPGSPDANSQKPTEDKNKTGDKNPGDKDKDKADQVKPVVRSSKPDQPFDPKTLNVRLDEDRMVRLNTQGVPWVDLINWLGEISEMSVDWQELPGDFVNFRTRRRYTVSEMRNIINRHLLARGYTILINDDMLAVEKIANINVSLVPRLNPSALDGHMDYEFAKVSFQLDSLIAQGIAKELQPMVSTNGKLTAFESTNRIEVMDSVGNLKQIYRLLKEEQTGASRSQTVKEFVFEHVPATVAVAKLKELLQIKGDSPAMSAAALQRQAQMMAQRRGQPQPGNPKQPPQAASKPKSTIVVNERRNSAIVQATPDKMAVIEQGIKLLDVPTHQASSLDRYLSRLRTYRLVKLDPKEVVDILQETGVMDPTTMLRVDEKSKAIIANAPPWDHLTIEKMIKKLDGKSGEFRVIKLRRRRAEQVAGTIEKLMGAKKDDNKRDRYRYWGYSRSDEKEEETFRVGADVEHNWLILWCNESEYEKVVSLLEELGEITSRDRNVNQIRVLENLPSDVDDETLDRLRRAFENMAPNQIQWDIKKRDKKEKKTKDEKTDQQDEKSNKPLPDEKITHRLSSVENLLAFNDENAVTDAAPHPETTFTESTTTESTKTDTTLQPAAPPIRISRTADGRLIVQSSDAEAVDLFEELASQILQRKKPFTVFKVEHQSATWIALTLEEFFVDETDEKDNREDDFRYYFWDYEPPEEDEPIGLGQRGKLLFVSDVDSKTIVVRNATESQLRTIEELIKLYDVKTPISKERARYTQMIKLNNAKAQDVADIIKGAFQDLLSKTDAAFRKDSDKKKKDGREEDSEQAESQNANTVASSLAGKLAIGIDAPSNVLVVSTKGEQLMKVVMEMIQKLDVAAQENRDVRVVQLKSSTPRDLHKTLLSLVDPNYNKNGQQDTAEKPAQNQPANGNGNGNNNNGGRSNRSNGNPNGDFEQRR